MTLGRYGQPEHAHETLRRHAFKRERCACGDVIEARSGLPSDVQAAVFIHRRSTAHATAMVRWHEALG